MEDTVRNIEFNSTVYERAKTSLVMDRSFKEFGQKKDESEKTVEQFFIDYEDLFFQIPIEGNINSHQYLIEKSSQLYKVENTLQDIQPLIDEINTLRSQSVVDQQTILELKLQLGQVGDLTPVEYEEYKTIAENSVAAEE